MCFSGLWRRARQDGHNGIDDCPLQRNRQPDKDYIRALVVRGNPHAATARLRVRRRAGGVGAHQYVRRYRPQPRRPSDGAGGRRCDRSPVNGTMADHGQSKDVADSKLAAYCSTPMGNNHWNMTQECAPTGNISEVPFSTHLRGGARQGKVTF